MRPLLTLFAALLLAPAAGAQTPYWNTIPSATTKSLFCIDFGNARAGYIGGKDSTLLRTLDGGVTWTKLTPKGMVFSAASPDIVDVNFVSAGTGYAIVSNHAFPEFKGVLYRTTDSGKTWIGQQPGNIAAARAFFFDANNGYVVGSAFFAGYTIIKRSAGTWGTEKSFGGGSSLFLHAIDFHNSSTGITGGTGGYVYRTFNGGATWDTVKTVVDTTITAIRFMSDRTILATTDNNGGALIISHDTGRTWDIDMQTLTFSYPAMKGLTASKKDSFIAVGHAAFGPNGLILWNENGMSNYWNSDQPLNDVTMRDDSIAYIVGDSGTIMTNRIPGLSVSPTPLTELPLLYPNPAAGSFRTRAAFAHTLRLYDAAGRLVVSDLRPAATHLISTRHLFPGLYMVECRSENGIATRQKLLIE